MLKTTVSLGLLIATLSVLPACTTDVVATKDQVSAEQAYPVQGLVNRILPGRTGSFVFETIPAPSATENVFEVDSRNGKIILRGDSVLSQCVALNYYLTHTAKVSVSCYCDVPIIAPDKLPLPAQTVRKTTKLKQRFFLNYCTFGYAFPWWQWNNWERFIDWMALQGINMPLAQGANEAIWQKVWKSYGLTDAELRDDFFSGPAHLPWNRMANLDKWQGPLPQGYIDGQLALTKRIVERERALGMKPILPAFAGHVPEALRRIKPDVKLSRLPGYEAGPKRPFFLAPKDPLFREIQVKFLREQAKELGTDHLYGTDPFNEIAPPSWEPAYLASVSKAIYDSMAEADPNAIWYQMAWTFQSGAWTPERLRAMIEAVPLGRMVLLDYYCEKTEIWRRHEKFYRAPFVWNYLGNFGGNNPVVGPVELVNDRIAAAVAEAPNLVGIGSTLEGLNNQSMHEFLFARAWETAPYDINPWFATEAQAHAGGADAAAEAGFKTFWKDVLGNRIAWNEMDAFTTRPRLSGGGSYTMSVLFRYDAAALGKAWKEMLNASPETRTRPGYLLDLADITRTALANQGDIVRGQLLEAWKKNDAAEFKKLSVKFLAIGADLDDFLGTRPEYLFGCWIEQARSWGKDAAEADDYEKNARLILTDWGARGGFFCDYANRTWNGLLKDYYLVRWKMYLDAMGAALDTAAGSGKPPVDAGPALMPKLLDFEWTFANTSGGKYPSKAQGKTFETSQRLFEKYRTPPAMPDTSLPVNRRADR
jgi:alpha-N-acetylglucosaminidase